ncbi:asparagine synthase (glutamine-hydrolyzing), partial [Peptostreptococcus porci]|uniref:asparagine synthase (glutamine-hydrolyzing) n=1 Tax=Peptostreptococcus porci TaxID=2652282 RepID=UPI002A916E36
MCGFTAFFDTVENKNEIIDNMNKRIWHRGPDMSGKYIDDNAAMGFVRLSILDLSESGAQPMYSEDGNKILVFNGEIYNYQDIKDDLIAKGYHFISETDSEVLIHGYTEYGTDLVNRLRGMFAFCIWDKQNKRVFGARDHFGIKPYYFYKYKNGNENGLLIGSEIKSFLEHPLFKKELNEKALKPYLTFQYSSQADETFFKGVERLKPGHFFIFENGEMKIEKYWDVSFNDKHHTVDENIKKIQSVMEESIKLHSHTDVPFGSFLSGGIDSSYVTA